VTQLSEHFALEEFEKGGPVLTDYVPVLREFCERILEPIRREFGKLLKITSGNRNSEYNRSVGGASDSQHVYTRWSCAADIQIPGVAVDAVFNWIRLSSGLPFDQVILERGRQERHEHDDCIHISYLRSPRQVALEGSTHGTGGYLPVKVG